jgi:hypothetical protein
VLNRLQNVSIGMLMAERTGRLARQIENWGDAVGRINRAIFDRTTARGQGRSTKPTLIMADISTAAKSLSSQSTFVPLTDKELEENGLVLDDLGLLIDEGLHKQDLLAKLGVFDDPVLDKAAKALNLQGTGTRREGLRKRARVLPEHEAHKSTAERPLKRSKRQPAKAVENVEPEEDRRAACECEEYLSAEEFAEL